MNTKRIVGIGLVSCAVVTFSYWLGYWQGGGARRAAEANRRVADTTAKPRHDPYEQYAETQRRMVNIPVRDPAAKADLLDLSSWYNAGLTGNWHGNAAENDFSPLPTGVQTLAGTEFDVRGLIQLRATDPGTAPFPVRLGAIPVGRRCRKLHFLHSALFARALPRGQIIGSYLLRYADGQTIAATLRLGENILDWWESPDKLPQADLAVIAWRGTNALSAKRGRSIHLSKFTWENPRPEEEVRSFDFISEGKTAGPFLVAVTAEP